MATYDEREDDLDSEGDYEPRPRWSGAVTAVAVVNFVLGGLTMLFGLLVLLMGTAITGYVINTVKNPPPGADPAQAKQAQDALAAGGGAIGIVVGAMGICSMIFGVPQIIAGIGVIKRRQWGRILTLVLAAMSGIIALLSVFALSPTIIVHAGYCIFAFVILLNRRYAAEFS